MISLFRCRPTFSGESTSAIRRLVILQRMINTKWMINTKQAGLIPFILRGRRNHRFTVKNRIFLWWTSSSWQKTISHLNISWHLLLKMVGNFAANGDFMAVKIPWDVDRDSRLDFVIISLSTAIQIGDIYDTRWSCFMFGFFFFLFFFGSCRSGRGRRYGCIQLQKKYVNKIMSADWWNIHTIRLATSDVRTPPPLPHVVVDAGGSPHLKLSTNARHWTWSLWSNLMFNIQENSQDICNSYQCSGVCASGRAKSEAESGAESGAESRKQCTWTSKSFPPLTLHWSTYVHCVG